MNVLGFIREQFLFPQAQSLVGEPLGNHWFVEVDHKLRNPSYRSTEEVGSVGQELFGHPIHDLKYINHNLIKTLKSATKFKAISGASN